MTVYIIRRLFQTVVMLFILSIMFFLLVRYQPSSSCGFTQLGCQELLKLDEPVTSQYLSYVSNLLHGNFGISTNGQAVGAIIAQRLPATIILVAVSIVFQQLIALPLGMLAALRQYSIYDSILSVLSYILLATPAFVLGEFFIFYFAQVLGWFPLGHSDDLALPLLGSSDWFGALVQDPGYVLGDMARHIVLPAFVLMSTGIAIDSRFMRSAMLQVLHQDYIRTARAKGVPGRIIVFKHAFRNALLPVITNLGLYFPALVGGVIVVETVFSFGGISYLFTLNGDLQTLQGVLLLSSVAVLLANLLADIGYAILDPRIRLGATGGE